MRLDKSILDNTQFNIFSLLPVYAKYGYSLYKMGKFEEYDFYSKNKDFLVSDSVITFTDTNGKLMALKPDVTLSIIKNSEKDISGVEKLYYNEKVYRVSKGTNCFKEITQVGVECIGDVGAYEVSEVLLLSAKSLEAISDSYVLEVSHLGILSCVIDSITSDYKLKKSIWSYVNEKNFHSIYELCKNSGIDENKLLPLKKILDICGKIDVVMPELEIALKDFEVSDLLKEFKNAVSIFKDTQFEDKIIIDFSAAGDFNYYNGIVFNGFVKGVPESVLSGGQYDALMKKMKRNSKAIGFAVYLDLLERLNENSSEFDFDVFLLYSENSDVKEIANKVNEFELEGKSVYAGKTVNKKLKFKEYYKLENGGVTRYE